MSEPKTRARGRNQLSSGEIVALADWLRANDVRDMGTHQAVTDAAKEALGFSITAANVEGLMASLKITFRVPTPPEDVQDALVRHDRVMRQLAHLMIELGLHDADATATLRQIATKGDV
jgi:hypothetical protein